jgi:hypothetical protein
LKFSISFLIVIFIYSSVNAQYPKWIVQFKDKSNSPYKFSNPTAYLSTKALQRRHRYNIAIDSADLPVTPLYIRFVVNQGPVKYLSQSKWLNQILIYCTNSATINAIRNLPFVKSVQPIGPGLTANAVPLINKFRDEKITLLTNKSQIEEHIINNFDYGYSYDQVHIHNGEFLHAKGFSGKGVTIAFLDAGFYKYKTTKAFDSARNEGRILGEKDFVDFDNSVNEDDTHGEYTLSTIAANVPGVMVGTAPHASFWLVRTEDVSSEYPVEEHNWVAGAEFADSVGADMITSSLGYFWFDDPAFNHSYADIYANTTMVSKGAAFAAKKGMIVTNSAGNEGANSWKYIIFPADADSVCTVGAVDVNGNIAYFSSYGYPGKIKPNIVSVGLETVVYTTFGVSFASGTSFSNPNINGLIACLWQAFPKFNNMTILEAVIRSCDRAALPDSLYGYGIPDMRKAYALLKRKQNTELYGNDWLFASLNENKINVKLIARVDGQANLQLMTKSGKVLSSLILNTEKEEIYDKDFQIISPIESSYIIQYSDAFQSKRITLNLPVAFSLLQAGNDIVFIHR